MNRLTILSLGYLNHILYQEVNSKRSPSISKLFNGHILEAQSTICPVSLVTEAVA